MSKLFDALEVDGLIQGYEECEVDGAQQSLDLQPSNSLYWDSRAGQDDLNIIRALGLQPNTTEAQRRDGYRRAMAAAREDKS